jgi:ribonuclease R
VAIADVSYYVRPGTALDREAKSRGTSVYFPERAFHMLPGALSENLCSLRPHEPRLAMVARMEFDRTGRRLQTEMMDAVIQSKRRATYNEIEAEWKAHLENPKHPWEFLPHFELYSLIRRKRSERGSIDFDLPEAEVRVDDQGEVLWIRHRPRLDAHRLIEEFMIAANEAVTHWITERGWPFVFRVHEEPEQMALRKFQKLAANAGIHVKIEGASDSPRVMAEVVRRLEGHPAQSLLNMALLRSMKQAVYTATHGIHYGLASEGYTHFTSPIRRYPDLVVHRLLRRAMLVEKGKEPSLKPKERTALEKELEADCEHCSYRERIAADADREATKLKQVRAMIPHLGSEFDGKIVGMVDSGMFVQLEDPFVEGFVSGESIGDDFYEFIEERMVFQGKRKRRVFRVGDRMKIRVVKADVDSRTIDFAMISESEPPTRPFNREAR